MLLNDAIVKRIMEIKEEHNFNYSRWSTKAGITSNTLYDIIYGKAGCPKIPTIKKLCDVVQMTLPEFFNVDYILNAECKDD